MGGMLNRQFSSLSSLVMLLMLSLGTAWLFSVAAHTNDFIEDIMASQGEVVSYGQSARASSTLLR